MSASPQFLVIVRREEATRYAALREAFAGEPVTLLWDRRRGERRRDAAPVGVERRRVDRRGMPPDTWRYLDFLLAPVGPAAS